MARSVDVSHACKAINASGFLSLAAGGLHVVTETVSLACSGRELGLSGKAWCTFSEEPSGPTVGFRIAYEFGALPLRPFPDSTECVGGVCRWLAAERFGGPIPHCSPHATPSAAQDRNSQSGDS
ncbi:hypothetical protein KJ567_03620 [Candidatus Bipolaricaulota bacterium]|nr:hypothetical protein [Candidatus Bipolaricaulota bacterium]